MTNSLEIPPHPLSATVIVLPMGEGNQMHGPDLEKLFREQIFLSRQRITHVSLFTFMDF
jgi:hypothetical protein